MAGSTMIFEADRLEDVKAWIEEDLYYTSRVVGSVSLSLFVDCLTNYYTSQVGQG